MGFLFSPAVTATNGRLWYPAKEGGCTVLIKDDKYNIDNQLADAIII